LNDHRIHGAAVLPAAAFIEMIAAAATEAFGSTPHSLRDVVIEEALVVPDKGEQTTQLIIGPSADGTSSFTVFSRSDAKSEWKRHANGVVRIVDATPTESEFRLPTVQARCQREIPVDEFYENASGRGIQFGASLRAVEKLWLGDNEALASIQLPAEFRPETKTYKLHPSLLDAAFQVAVAAAAQSSSDLFLPVGCESFHLLSSGFAQGWAHARVRARQGVSKDTYTVDITIADDAGHPVAEVTGLHIKRVPVSAGARALQVQDWLYTIHWIERSRSKAAVSSAPGDWLIFSNGDRLGEQLTRLLENQGARCIVVRRDTNVINSQLFEQVPALRGIVFLWSTDEVSSSDDTVSGLQQAQDHGSRSVLSLVQALLAKQLKTPPRLWLVTREAQVESANVALKHAPLWGLGRVIASEHPEFRCTLVDLEGDGLGGDIEAVNLFDEIWNADREQQVALRGGMRRVARLTRSHTTEPGDHVRTVPANQPYRVDIQSRGILDQLALSPDVLRQPGTSEVQIEVRAAGLNFRDVLNALGTYPGPAGPLGLECSGRITAVGEGVTNLKVGQDVVAIASPAFASSVTAAADYVVPKPETLGFEEAATIPVAFLTAHYGLHHLAKLKAGDRVLIHAAAGGVGLAAVQIALRAGAEIFATAGSPQKREVLTSLGVHHVMNSRTLDFADDILKVTSGRGVDIVLNSLAGDFITKSMSILAPGGRFIEIGKADLWTDERVAQFKPGITYRAFDLLQIAQEDPGLVHSMLATLIEDISTGTLKPLPRQVFQIGHVVGAFRYMAQAKHIGKVVLSFPGNDVAAEVPVREDATYLITGGLGALGLHVAQYLVKAGARQLVLVGRSNPSEQATAAIREMEATGATVSVHSTDIADETQVGTLIAWIRQTQAPLRGIVHAAGVLDDGTLLQQTWERFEHVMAAKMRGSWNLHTLTKDVPLDFFVLFSSAASVFGSPGQSNYSAANAFLDSLAHYRWSLGLPAMSINWGPWSEAGMAAGRSPFIGIQSLSPTQGIDALDQLLRRKMPQVAVLPVKWEKIAPLFKAKEEPPFLADILAHAGSTGESTQPEISHLNRNALLAASADEQRPLLETYLREQVGRVLSLAPSRVDVNQPIGSLGLDSLMAVELRNRIDRDLGIVVPAVMLLQQPTVASLTQQLLSQLGAPGQEPIATAVMQTAATLKTARLSSAQRWMWVLHQLDPENPWCNFPMACRLTGPLDVAAFERSVNEIVRRHEVVRTRIVLTDDQPAPSTDLPEPFALLKLDLSEFSALDREARVLQLAAEEFMRQFDLERGPLIRATLVRLGPEENVAFVTMHHIASDVLSMEIFLRELEQLYPAFLSGKPSPLAELPIQYKDYAIWEGQWLQSESIGRQLIYWKQRLAGPPPVLEFPTDRARTADQAYQGTITHLDLPHDLTQRVRDLGRATGSTLYMTLLAAFQTLLYRYTNQDDFTVGSFASSRTRPELNGLIGCFVNHLVLRADVSGGPTFRELMMRVRDVTLEAYANQDVPFELLLDALDVKRDLLRTPLFQVAFAFDPVPTSFALPGLKVADLGLDHIHSNFDFALRIREHKDNVRATMEYNGALFEASTIQRLLGAFQTLLTGICANPDEKISALPLLSDAEQRQLLGDLNETTGQELEGVTLQKLRRARRKQVR
jgi:myxalamid-type polyketide synthase MxaB